MREIDHDRSRVVSKIVEGRTVEEINSRINEMGYRDSEGFWHDAEILSFKGVPGRILAAVSIFMPEYKEVEAAPGMDGNPFRTPDKKPEPPGVMESDASNAANEVIEDLELRQNKWIHLLEKSKGIRSTQLASLIELLVEKGVL